MESICDWRPLVGISTQPVHSAAVLHRQITDYEVLVILFETVFFL